MFAVEGLMKEVSVNTYRPGELKGDDNGPEVIGLVWVSIESFQLKRIPSDNARASSSVRTKARCGDLHLVFL